MENDKPLTPKQRVLAVYPTAVYKPNPDGAPGGYIYFASEEKVGTIPKSSGVLGENGSATGAWKNAADRLTPAVGDKLTARDAAGEAIAEVAVGDNDTLTTIAAHVAEKLGGTSTGNVVTYLGARGPSKRSRWRAIERAARP